MLFVLKMLSEIVENRQINTFPRPFRGNVSPYRNNEFSEVTKNVTERSEITASLKICKVIVIGDLAVGKTCIINRFCRQIYDSNYKSTIGVDFEVENFSVLGMPFTLQIWDTAGQERFKSIAQSYYRGAHVIIVVFDLSNIFSLAHTNIWLKEALTANINSEPLLFMVGTKKDLVSSAAYKNLERDISKLANNLGTEYWAVSSKTGENIEKLFFRIAALSFDIYVQKECATKMDNVLLAASDVISFKKNAKKENTKSKCISHCV